MTIWLISDEHHGHVNIILPTYCNRPFTDIDDMTRGLVERHNAVVQDDDTVWHVGDFSLSEKYVPLVLPQLRGKHILVAGNHDKCHPKYGQKAIAAKQRYLEYGFSEINIEMQLGPFLVSHMPYLEVGDIGHDARYAQYRPKDNGGWLLNGHVHTAWKTKNRMINIGCDVWDFTPVRYETLLEMAK